MEINVEEYTKDIIKDMIKDKIVEYLEAIDKETIEKLILDSIHEVLVKTDMIERVLVVKEGSRYEPSRLLVNIIRDGIDVRKDIEEGVEKCKVVLEDNYPQLLMQSISHLILEGIAGSNVMHDTMLRVVHGILPNITIKPIPDYNSNYNSSHLVYGN